MYGHVFIQGIMETTNTCMLYAEIKYFRFMIKFQLFCLIAISYVAVQFHVSYKYGLMYNGVKVRNVVNDSS